MTRELAQLISGEQTLGTALFQALLGKREGGDTTSNWGELVWPSRMPTLKLETAAQEILYA